MYYKKTSFLVAGLQKSGLSSAKLLLERGAKVYIYDKRKSEEVVKNIDKLQLLGCVVVDDYKSAVDYIDVLVISPGVPIDSDICITYKKAGKRIIGELELGFLEIKAPLIAVTGTNGKTTVSTLIHKVLKDSGLSASLSGNVGTPITSVVDKINKSELSVVEVSSYQLETTYLFTPHVSVVLNITPDHLERHYSMENYALVKSKIVIPLKESEFAILNYDDDRVKEFSNITKAKVLWFSVKEEVDGGYLKEESLYFKGEKIIEIDKLLIKEPHNIQNVLATVCALKAVGVETKEIVKSLTNFKGVKHRFETVCEKDGITFINDSKSTNPDSTIKALSSLKTPAVLIVGGSDKHLDYTELFERIKNSSKITRTVITGQSADGMLSSAINVGLDKVSVVKGFDEAVKTAFKLCSKGEAVLLSPATASFDEFKDFEERGERFVKVVNSL